VRSSLPHAHQILIRAWLKFVGRKDRRPRFSGDFPAEAGRPTDFSHILLIPALLGLPAGKPEQVRASGAPTTAIPREPIDSVFILHHIYQISNRLMVP